MQLGLELGVGVLDLAGLRPHGPRHPVDGPQLVEDVALDPGDGVGLELEAPLGLELVDGIDQPEQPVGGEVGLLHVLGQAHRHTTGHVLHQGRVVDDELVTGPPVAVVLVRGPETFDVGGRHLVANGVGHERPLARGCVADSTACNREALT